jgi:tetratricopeptide (TPR) repeat protein
MKSRPFLSLLLLSVLLPSAYADASPKELLASGHVDEAILALEQATHSSAPDAESYNLLCRAYYMIDEWDRGIAACERAVKLAPENSLYHLWLARIYGEKADHSGFLSGAGLVKKVRTEFERAVELDPKSSEARADLADFYLEAPSIVGGGKDKARAQAEALASFNPAMADYVTGQIADKEKDAETAERAYRAAIQTSHGTAIAWLHLAQFMAHAGRFDEMDEALHSMSSAPLDHPEALMDAASLLLHFGRDYVLAIRLLQRYLANGPVEEGPAFKAHDFLGRLLEKQGDRQAAAEQYRAALALSHTYTRAREHLKRVENVSQ